MTFVAVKCPGCGEPNVVRNGTNKKGIQRYYCKNKSCSRTTFMLEYKYNGCKPETDSQIIKMTSNASGIRDISRVLEISTKKVTETLKKQQRQ